MEGYIQNIFEQMNWKFLGALKNSVIEEGVTIQQIPAPTFQEQNRAHYVQQQFRKYGLKNVEIDETYNVYGLLHGDNRHTRGILISAHIDTVFPIDTDLRIERQGDLIYGPGLGDNSIAVASLLGLIKTLLTNDWKPAINIWFVATSCEEGLGNLNGMRQAYTQLQDKIHAVINLEGLSFGHVYNAGTAVRRLKITAHAEGGHSWLHFGRPSAIHSITQLGARISEIHVPQKPRTTYNIGLIEGGRTINTISPQASLWLDMRSEQLQQVDKLHKKVEGFLKDLEAPGLHFDVEVVGDRPSGETNPTHPLVQGGMSILEQLGVRSTLEIGSTDANIPLSMGCPAITIGITKGGNAHRLDEYIETEPITRGLQQLITLALATAQYYARL